MAASVALLGSTTLLTGVAPASAATTVHPVTIYATTTAETSNVDEAVTEQRIRDDFAGMSKYWSDQSGGQVDFEIEKLVWAPGKGVCGDKNPTIRQDARTESGFTSGPDKHLFVLVAAGCRFTGNGSATSGLDSGGQVYIEGFFDGLWTHEFGHNLGFNHANLLDCPDGSVDGALISAGGTCRSQPYEDAFDTMGGSQEFGYVGFSTPNAIREGLLSSADYSTIDSAAATDQTITIQSRDLLTGMRSVKVTDPISGTVYYVEMSSKDGYSAGVYSIGSKKSYSGDDGFTYQRNFGVRVLKFEANGTSTLALPAPVVDGVRSTSWAAGTTFTSAAKGVDVTVESTTATTATLRIRTHTDLAAPDAPAVATATPSQVTGTAEPGSTITVSDPAGATVGSTTTTTGGEFTAPLDPAQPAGTTLSLTATDAEGNTSGSSTTTVAVTATPPAAPTVDTIDSTSVTGRAAAGTTITVTNGNDETVGSTMTGDDGKFAAALIPGQQPGTTLTVTATDPSGNTSYPTAVQVPSTPVAAPKATVTAKSLHVGDEQTVHGTGFAPNESVTAVMHSAPFQVGTATTNVDGDVDFTWTIPAGTDVGGHDVTLTGIRSGPAIAAFAITADATNPPTQPTQAPSPSDTPSAVPAGQGLDSGGPTGGDLAYTGADIAPQLAPTLALLTIGTLGLLFARRRRSQSAR